MNRYQFAAFRLANGVLGRIAPRSTARRLARTFMSPRDLPRRSFEDEAETTAERLTLATGISALRWKGTGPRLLAIHGWEGRATQFGAMASQLGSISADVIALDGPAHGQSTGSMANPVLFARALLDADRELGPFDAVIGHSMGAASASLALSWGLRADRAVILAGPASVVTPLRSFAGFLGVPESLLPRLLDEVGHLAGGEPHALDIEHVAPRLTVPYLVIHDIGDADVPFAESQRVVRAVDGARLVATKDLGHHRVMREPQVIAEIEAFLEV